MEFNLQMVVLPLIQFYTKNNIFCSQIRAYIVAIFLTAGRKNCSAMSRWSGVNRMTLYAFLKNHEENVKSMKMFLEEEALQAISRSKKSCMVFDFTMLNKPFASSINNLTYDYDGVTGRVGKGISLGICAVSTQEITIPLDYKSWLQKKIAGDQYVSKVTLAKQVISEKLDKFKVDFILVDGAFASKDFLQFMQTIETSYIMRIPRNRKVLYNGELVQLQEHPGLRLVKNQKAITIETQYKGIPCFITAHKRKGKNGTKEVVFLVSNASMDPWDYINTYDLRWSIEKSNRTSKQSLGIAQNQTVTAEKQSAHIFATFVSYTLLQLQIMNKLNLSSEDVLKSIRSQNLDGWNIQSSHLIETLTC